MCTIVVACCKKHARAIIAGTVSIIASITNIIIKFNPQKVDVFLYSKNLA